MSATFVYVSNAIDGDISMFRMAPDGALLALGRVAAGPAVMPLAVSPDKRHLYAAIRSQPYNVIAYRIDAESGLLTQAGSAPLADSMAYISTDRRGRLLFAASYGGDIVSVNRIGDDGLPQGAATQVIRTGRHAHSIIADAANRFVYGGNLGVDRVLQFALDTQAGELKPVGDGSVAAPAGSGPRHLVFSPDGRFVHVLGELSGTVTTYSADARSGALTQVHEVQGVPASLGLAKGIIRAPNAPADDAPRIWASDIRMTPDGRFVYMAERTSSSISVFSADAGTGALTYAGNSAVEKQPRGFNIDPTGRFVVVSGEKSAELGVYAIHGATGALALLNRHPCGQGANWVEIVGFA